MIGDPFHCALTADLFGDSALRALFNVDATLRRYGAFEAALAEAQAAEGLIEPQSAAAIAAALQEFRPDLARLRIAAARDGLVPPDYVRQLRSVIAEPHKAALHAGATSQDVIDTATALAARDANGVLQERLQQTDAALANLANRVGDTEIMGRTRMQAALPIRASWRIEQWRQGLAAARGRLIAGRPDIEVLQLGGPVGDRRPPLSDAVARRMAVTLGLTNAPCWHTDRTRIAAYGAALTGISGACGKVGQDVALMAQMSEIRLSGGGGSSAMPHKQNPVRAEALVALARHSATLSGGLAHGMIHEQERSGAAWALEALTLPALMEAAAASLRNAHEVVLSVQQMGG